MNRTINTLLCLSWMLAFLSYSVVPSIETLSRAELLPVEETISQTATQDSVYPRKVEFSLHCIGPGPFTISDLLSSTLTVLSALCALIAGIMMIKVKHKMIVTLEKEINKRIERFERIWYVPYK
jgi:uncharacterized membrane protein YciS (DUF1049 family)